MKKYKFYGWQTADCKPADSVYDKIENSRHLYDILSQIWSAETCAPRMRENWTRENQTLGQCSITAFLAQYENNPEQFREVHWKKEEKRLHYECLKAELLKKLEGGVAN